MEFMYKVHNFNRNRCIRNALFEIAVLKNVLSCKWQWKIVSWKYPSIVLKMSWLCVNYHEYAVLNNMSKGAEKGHINRTIRNRMRLPCNIDFNFSPQVELLNLANKMHYIQLIWIWHKQLFNIIIWPRNYTGNTCEKKLSF